MQRKILRMHKLVCKAVQYSFNISNRYLSKKIHSIIYKVFVFIVVFLMRQR